MATNTLSGERIEIKSDVNILPRSYEVISPIEPVKKPELLHQKISPKVDMVERRRSTRLNVVEDIVSSTSYIQRQRWPTRRANERKPSKHITRPYTSLKQKVAKPHQNIGQKVRVALSLLQ